MLADDMRIKMTSKWQLVVAVANAALGHKINTEKGEKGKKSIVKRGTGTFLGSEL